MKINDFEVGVSEEQRGNLAMLRDFLLTNDVPFEMSCFRSTVDSQNALEVTKDQLEKGVKGCGTAGCAVGWAPFIIPTLPGEFYTGDDLKMRSYGERVFGDAYRRGELFALLFGGSWTDFDNTREGAAYRIDVFLNLKDGDDFPFVYVPEMTPDGREAYEMERDAWLAKHMELTKP